MVAVAAGNGRLLGFAVSPSFPDKPNDQYEKGTKQNESSHDN
jgi:hypothetical protein